MLALLRAGPFRRYIIGSLISDSGTWMQWMAQGYVMSTLTDSAFMIGLATFATGIATIVFTPTGGSAADRSDKRKILIATQVAQIVFARRPGMARPNPSSPHVAHDTLWEFARNHDWF